MQTPNLGDKEATMALWHVGEDGHHQRGGGNVFRFQHDARSASPPYVHPVADDALGPELPHKALLHNAASNPPISLFISFPFSYRIYPTIHPHIHPHTNLASSSPPVFGCPPRESSRFLLHLIDPRSTMVPPRKDDLGRGEGSDRSSDGDAAEGFRAGDGSGSTAPPSDLGRTVPVRGIAERLRNVLRAESDDDLSLENRGDGDDPVLPWLQALDLQVLGACRADERSKPLLKLNVTSGPAEERLLAQLSQHFEASEVGMLARCLCVPLVSVRVGKVKKEGNIVCPTTIRGQLNLNLLPSSNMRISFIGDDGCTERLAVLSNGIDSSDASIEEISADTSGRSFLLKLPGNRMLYYWCSEKSKIHGLELLSKMKDLLKRKPSLSCLTGISESRLDSFATHLRAYLIGCSNTAEINSAAASHGLLGSNPSANECHSSCAISRSLRSRTMTAHIGKVHSFYQGSLSPRLNSFKDEMPRTLFSIRSREKIKRHGDIHLSTLTRNTELVTSISASCTVNAQHLSESEDEKSRGTKPSSTLSCCLPDIQSLPSPLPSFNPISIHLTPSQTSVSSSFSPYYCWCPPGPSSLQYKVTPSSLSTSSDSIHLPPLSSLLSAAAPAVTSVPSRLPIDVSELRAFSIPTLVLDPLVPTSISVPSLAMPCPQQLPIFTPFMSDPIVHVPVIDFCSSGQGYLVSAGPAISSVISPLLPSFVNPLIPKTESAMEKSARETLQMLIASAPTVSGPQLMNVLPAVFNNLDENFSCASKANNHSSVATTGSQLFYGSTLDVDAVSPDLSCLDLYTFEGIGAEVDNSMRCVMEEHNDSDGPPKDC
ncbi:hypothetical protein Cni_G29172 [Canna indica]|uniref:Uncharacterized protein n=1 Tax=Canna indica TaxID=4628 RepID=A0AAQ3L3U6_9LILI|nr:hypothetical protein Cni_G29172 [Canna indica]